MVRDTITQLQYEFIKIKADPDAGLKGLTYSDIAEMLGVSVPTINNWVKNPEIKKAIAEAREKEPEKIYPRMLKEAEDIAFGRVRGSTFEKLRAMELWFRAGGHLKKTKGTDESAEKETSFERKLMEIAGESSRDSSKATD